MKDGRGWLVERTRGQLERENNKERVFRGGGFERERGTGNESEVEVRKEFEYKIRIRLDVERIAGTPNLEDSLIIWRRF